MNKFPNAELATLWATIDRLLAEDGCPWDREQTSAKVARSVIDEGHEWLEACEGGDGEAEELGDLAYLILFGLQALANEGKGEPGAILRGIDAKLRRRHPHLFPGEGAPASAAPADAEEQLLVWETVKRREREESGRQRALLKPLPRSLGALARSHRYQEKAAGFGFDWPDLAGVMAKLREETAELEAEIAALPVQTPAGDGQPSARYRAGLAGKSRERASDELGDLLFVTANLCRWLGFDAEEVAERANAKFLRRFAAMERSLEQAGGDLMGADLDEMERHWRRVKESE